MNTGTFTPGTTGFAFGTPSSTAIVNPLGGAPVFTSQANATALGGTTQGIFGPIASTAPTMFGSTAPSLFGGTNTTISTGTAPSTGIFTGQGVLGGIKPIGLPTTSSSLFGPTNPTPCFSVGQTTFPTLGSIQAPIVSTSVAPVGLGGVDFSQVSAGGGASTGKSDSKTIKEQVLPTEISESINNFRKFVKEQKVVREEISRVSSKPIYKVQEETAALKQILCVLSSGLQRNTLAIEKLKAASAQDLKNAEIAQRTKDLPPSLQFENIAPTQYFQELVCGFEKQMLSCRQQIEQLEQHFSSLSQPFILSTQELNIIVRRLHETFVALAAQLQTTHDAVRMQKEAFLGIRRSVMGESTNIFEQHGSSNVKHRSTSTVPVTLGPAPFSSYPSAATMVMANALHKNQPASGLGSSGTFGSSQNTLSLFGSSSNPLGGYSSQSFASPGTMGVDNKPFQLQKPPSGNKRGKRWTNN